MTIAERTMREERWMLTDELHSSDRPEPPEVAAFRVLQEDDWAHFVHETEGNAALKFFNLEQREFNHAPDWEALAESQGIEPYEDRWAIPVDLVEDAQDFARQLRCLMRQFECDETKAPDAFHVPGGEHFDAHEGALLVVAHEYGPMESFFAWERDMTGVHYRAVNSLLEERDLFRARKGPLTYILRKPVSQEVQDHG